jgi:Zn-dependent protease
MFLVEPPPSQGDLHFQIFGFPVRVTPWFWAVTLILALNTKEKVDPKRVLVWVAVVFVSIVVHELGHAVLQRRYGGRPRIVLYGFGGMAISDNSDRSPSIQILISLAGPIAGFLFAAATLIAIRLAGHDVQFDFSGGILDALIPRWEWFDAPLANLLIFDLLYVNIFWGLVNLLPVYPLDGGQVSRELFTLNQPHRGIVQSLWLSAAVAGAIALLSILGCEIYTALLFGYLAYANYQNIQAYDRHWG